MLNRSASLAMSTSVLKALPVNLISKDTNLILIISGPRRKKNCLRGFANNKGADQPAHSLSLISAFVIRLLEIIISRLATSEISIF